MRPGKAVSAQLIRPSRLWYWVAGAALVGSAGTWAQGTAPEGWFPDPGGRHELRYWDGQKWTEHVSDRGTQAADPM